jgi:hypothetical protein
MQNGSFLRGNGILNINKFEVDTADTIFMTRFTSGQVQAVLYTAGGAGLVTIGSVSLPEGLPLIRVGIPIFAEGVVRSGAEILGGKTSSIPSSWSTMSDIGSGLYNSYGKGCQN